MVAKWREAMIETVLIARLHVMAITFVNEAMVESAQYMDLSSRLAGLLAKAYGTSGDSSVTNALVKRLERAENQLMLADRIVHKALHPAVNARRAEKRFKRAMFFAGAARETFLCLVLELGEWYYPTDKEDDFFHL